jgi:uncharacterized protein YabN with tetrapyrrole methylase and pyrophosphatase domain
MIPLHVIYDDLEKWSNLKKKKKKKKKSYSKIIKIIYQKLIKIKLNLELNKKWKIFISFYFWI